jgi:glycosyltransferase involved in cell wall biosynthesis
MRDYSVIYNGTKRESKIRGKILENERKKILLNIGTLEKRKNQIFLIEMFSELLKMNINYELWLIGGGEDGEKLKEAVDKKNIYSNVFFLGKVENVNEYLSKTFMYLHAALIENFSVALLEAQSFGIPIIAPPVGGIPELVKDGFNGYLLNTNEENIPNWVNKIEELAKNRSVYVELSKNSSFTFENNFTKEIMIKQYLGIYKSV